MYTGPRLLFNLLFILAFLVPYAAKTMLWVGVNRAQDALETTSDSLVVRIDQQAVKAQALLGRAEDRLRNRNEALATRIAEAAANVDIRMLRSRLRALEEDVRAADTLAADFLAQAAQLITTAAPDSSLLSPCLQEHCQEYAIIEVLLSLDRLDDHGAEEDGTSMTLAARFGPTILAVLLILYNVCRGLLTWLVAPMRDEEERSGHAPSYEPENGYGGRFIEIARDSTIPWYRVPLAWSTEVFSTYRWLTGPRIAVQTLFWVAMVVLAYNVYLFLFATTVQLPAG